jgi:exodeoxyribonuclease V gamma subunit
MFRQYHGNDMDLLRRLACEVLAHDPPPPLALEHVVVPNVGMAKWLRQGVAARLGIAAQISCDLPASFLDRLAALVLGPGDAAVARAYAKEQLGLRIMALLPGLLDGPGFEPLRVYLDDRRDPRRLLALSRQLATLYDQYLVYRPQWMQAWEAGRPAPGEPERAQPWQPVLWRAVCAQVRALHPEAVHGAGRTARLLEALRGAVPPPGLPARITGFGLGALTPGLLATLEALGRHVDVHLFQFNPCREFWGDIVSERTLARWKLLSPDRATHAETGNALLASWGGLGRRQLQLLLEATEGEVRPCFREVSGGSLLAAVQNDILALCEGSGVRAAAQDTTSIVFAETHSRLREVEALHDALLDLCERLPGLRPRDIVVMSPDIALYAGHVEAVFGELRGSPRYLPFTIADRADAAGGAIARSFLHLLGLPDSRFTAPEVCGLLAVPAIAERFGLDALAVEDLRALVARSGIRWGLDAEASAGTGPGLARNTWRFGLQRLLLGVALEEGGVYAGIAPLAPAGSEGMEQVGVLAECVALLGRWATELGTPRRPADWQRLLERLLADFYADSAAHTAERAELRGALAAVFDALATAGFDAALPREALIDLIAERLGEPDGAHAFLRGAVSFCQLTPLRCIPFRVVCLLGMNAEDFPRNRERAGFDLMGLHPAPGDPSRRDDDRYLFLESVLAARDCLYISRVARDERSDAAREAAMPVSELRDYLDAHHGEDTAKRLTRRHHLKPFHPDYFRPEAPLPSYREEWVPAVQPGNGAAPRFCAEPLPPVAAGPLALTSLESFFRNPCRGFFAGRFEVRFAEANNPAEDCEPIELDHLQLHALKRELAEAALAGDAVEAELEDAVLARGELPLGAAGRSLLRRERTKLDGLVQRLRDSAPEPRRSVEIALQIGERPLQGVLSGLRGARLLDYSVSENASASSLVVFWIRHLAACAVGAVAAPSELHDAKKAHRLPLLSAEDAHARLADLLALYDDGLRRPLPLFGNAALAFARALYKDGDEDGAMQKARVAFLDGFDREGECRDVHIARAFPDPQAALDAEFQALAARVYGWLVDALAEGEA